MTSESGIWDCHLSAAIATWMRQNTHTHTHSQRTAQRTGYRISGRSISQSSSSSSFSLLSLLPSEEKYARAQAIEDWKQHGSNCVLHLRARFNRSNSKMEKSFPFAAGTAARTHSRPSTLQQNTNDFIVAFLCRTGDARLLSATITDFIWFRTTKIPPFAKCTLLRRSFRPRVCVREQVSAFPAAKWKRKKIESDRRRSDATMPVNCNVCH